MIIFVPDYANFLYTHIFIFFSLTLPLYQYIDSITKRRVVSTLTVSFSIYRILLFFFLNLRMTIVEDSFVDFVVVIMLIYLASHSCYNDMKRIIAILY